MFSTLNFIPAILLSAVVLSSKSGLEESRQWAQKQNWEKAAECALKVLEEARESDDLDTQAAALNQLSAIDLWTWRDSQAWIHACEAETIARKTQNDTLLADALINKGKVCEYGNIDGGNPRDEEGLGYFKEALARVEDKSARRQVEIWYNISQIYVNMNRFNNPIDKAIYRRAGEALEKGDSIAKANSLKEFKTKAYPFKMRYYRQGDQIEEGIKCCLNTLALTEEKDYLMKSQVYDHLVSLYAKSGQIDMAVKAHQQCINNNQFFMQEKADNLLQEMESQYENKKMQSHLRSMRFSVIVLILLALSLTAGASAIFILNTRLRKSKDALQLSNDTKDQLLGFISRELSSSGENISDWAEKLLSMDEEQIRGHCKALFKGNTRAAEEIADYLVSLVKDKRRIADDLGLTDREIEILRYCKKGYTNDMIAKCLFISVNTVKNHKQNIFSKLDVHTTTEMLSAAEKAKLL